ncbi:hypothetical protein COBT_002308 [Conglomerata obtusa]
MVYTRLLCVLISLVCTMEDVVNVNNFNPTKVEALEGNLLIKANLDSSDLGSRTDIDEGKSIEEGLINGVSEKSKITTKMHNFVYINRLFLFYINLQISYNESFAKKYEVVKYYGKVFEDIFEICKVSPKHYSKFLNKNISFIECLYDNQKHLLDAKNDLPFIKYEVNLNNEPSVPLDIAISEADTFFDRYEFITGDQERYDIKYNNKKSNYEIIHTSLAKLIDLKSGASMFGLNKFFNDKQAVKTLIKIEMPYEIIEHCLQQHITPDSDVFNFNEYVEIYEKSIDEIILANLIRDFKINYIGSDLVMRYRKLILMRDNFFATIFEKIKTIWNYIVEKMRSFIR